MPQHLTSRRLSLADRKIGCDPGAAFQPHTGRTVVDDEERLAAIGPRDQRQPLRVVLPFLAGRRRIHRDRLQSRGLLLVQLFDCV